MKSETKHYVLYPRNEKKIYVLAAARTKDILFRPMWVTNKHVFKRNPLFFEASIRSILASFAG